MVKCKDKHIFSTVSFNMATSIDVVPKGVGLTSCCELTMNGVPHLLFTTNSMQCAIHKLPDLSKTAEFAIGGIATTSRTFA